MKPNCKDHDPSGGKKQCILEAGACRLDEQPLSANDDGGKPRQDDENEPAYAKPSIPHFFSLAL